MKEVVKINNIVKKIFGLEQKEFILLLFFLAIFVFCIYSLIVILIEEKNLFKQLKEYKIIEKHKQEILLILILPIIFLILVCFGLIEFEGWLGFFGGYFGVLGAFGAVWWQTEKTNELEKNLSKEEYVFFLKYIKCQIEKNLWEFDEKKNALILAYTYHKKFLFVDEIFNVHIIEKNIYYKFLNEILKNSHKEIIQFVELTLEFQKIIQQTFILNKKKPTILQEIIGIKDNLEKDFDNFYGNPTKNDELKKIFEKLRVLNNFISLSYKMTNSKVKAILYYSDNIKDIKGFLIGYQNKIFEGYSALGRIENKKIVGTNETTEMELYLFYYEEILKLFSIPPFFEFIDSNYLKIYEEISDIYHLDKKRMIFLEEYKKILESNLILINNYLKNNTLK